MSCAGCSYEDLKSEIQKEFRDFKVVSKEDSRLMRCIATFLWLITFGLSREFMSGYVTTIGFKVYVPASWRSLSDVNRCITLRHERVHMRQRRKYGMLLYSFMYLVFPLPGGLAWFRTKFEMEAYEETIRATIELYPNGAQVVLKQCARENMIQNFIGPMYFWMWPFRNRIERWYDEAVARILAGQKVV